ncbi:50S ribosomal protein L10 [Siphonobacter aquaeclarae]|jgi:large subunit ribosomal protein L10|uniref:Large ribosomal subunit protein uL10 n=1 Tax=Siphonobacter aquaeclarae TaxID=563176 RepID=A0A1G9VL80_9BACT|nr:50S ribosomal protein L10 [Siphonobacter aquaeclarae]MBO9639574.1 50S ribosomal protein L10 [Siphonobacter aquaeclarae]SDM72860.1 LSU ribosomal protein L10P [Siphonobacter aquaeclarae]
MTREEKGVIIEELAEKFKTTPYFYITDAGGMSVAQTNDLRRKCFQAGIEYRVVKNTLIAKALEQLDTDYVEFTENVLKGFSGIMFHPESGKAPAKLIKDFIKESGKANKLKFKGASVDYSVFIGEDQLETLLNLKSKQELVGEIIGLLQSPAKNVISGLQGGGNKIAGILKTLGERPE